jgi:Thrombospondin type 3 repeat
MPEFVLRGEDTTTTCYACPVLRGWMLVGALATGCGFQPQAGTADASVDAPDADPSNDQDHDGIVDSLDNCPTVFNPDQRDHDGDKRGDACDLCPHIATLTDTDTDGDGIGDECDPRPNQAGDHVVLWEGFYDASSITGWIPGGAGGDWFWQNGTLVQQIASSGERTFTAPNSYQHIYVATSFVVGALQTGGLLGFCSGVASPQQYCCVLDQSGPTLLVTTGGVPVSTPWPSTFAPDDHIQLVQNTATNNHCDASTSSGAHAAVSSTLAATAGKLDLYAASAAATFDYLFVVEIGN